MLPDLARVLDEAEARQLPALIADWSDLRARRWIARALRIDLAVLTERPELAVPCLFRRCAWPGSEHEAAFYRERPRVPDDALAVRTLAEEWAAEWGHDRPWLRALRPPEVAVDGGVIEEYRTGARGELHVDRDTVAVIGEQTVAWERATGRRIAATRVTTRRSPRWRFGERTWGSFALESDGRGFVIQHADSEIARDLFELADGLVVVTGGDEENGHLYLVVDVERARVQWRGAGRYLAAAADDRHAYVASPGSVEVRSLATGDRRGAWSAPTAQALVLAGDDHVATRSGDVIRIWDAREAMRRNSSARTRRAWFDVELSTDGEFLATGGLLCDGKTGTLIAELAVNGPGWLEGGPPVRCQRLTREGLVEITPFGLSLWDAATGNLAVRDAARGARNGDGVAFDPMGRYYATVRRGRLELRTLRGDRALLVRDETVATVGELHQLGFTPDGEALWWIAASGEELAVRCDRPTVVLRERVPHEAAPARVVARDGLVTFGAAAIPVDGSELVVSPAGGYLASPVDHLELR